MNYLRAVSGLSRIEARPMEKNNEFVLRHKSGEKYTDINFKFPFFHKKEYEENIYSDGTDLYSESELSNYFIVKDCEVYNRPYIHIYFLDGGEKYEHFNTDESTFQRYLYLEKQFELKLLDNDRQ